MEGKELFIVAQYSEKGLTVGFALIAFGKKNVKFGSSSEAALFLFCRCVVF